MCFFFGVAFPVRVFLKGFSLHFFSLCEGWPIGKAEDQYMESNPADASWWPGGGSVATWKGWKDTESWNNKNSESWKVSNDSWKVGAGMKAKRNVEKIESR